MADRAFLSVRVTPRSARDEIAGWQDDVLLVRLRAPPVEGRANQALRRLLADRLGLSVSEVEVASGAASRHKLLRISGLSATELRERLTGTRD